MAEYRSSFLQTKSAKTAELFHIKAIPISLQFTETDTVDNNEFFAV